jgi:hypothetical protein
LHFGFDIGAKSLEFGVDRMNRELTASNRASIAFMAASKTGLVTISLPCCATSNALANSSA